MLNLLLTVQSVVDEHIAERAISSKSTDQCRETKSGEVPGRQALERMLFITNTPYNKVQTLWKTRKHVTLLLELPGNG